MNEIVDKYEARARVAGSLLCVGLDSGMDRIREDFRAAEHPQYAFNHWIIKSTHPYAAAYKLNMAFYEAHGEAGWQALRLTMAYLQREHPDILTICDAKRADIGSTNQGYVQAIFDDLGFDAVTLHPYLGHEALEPFLQRTDKASIILCRTSNPGSGELQSLEVDGKPLWQIVAERAGTTWNANGNVMLVMGATYPEELRQVRSIVGDMTLLVPGIGAQGGELEAVVRGSVNGAGLGLIINASRSIITATAPSEAARDLRDAINRFR